MFRDPDHCRTNSGLRLARTLTAKATRATDTNGAQTNSALRTVTISDANAPPKVSLSAPANQATFVSPTIGDKPRLCSQNVTTISAPITLISNNLPTVSITAPANNAEFIAPASMTLTAIAADSDGTIDKVEFYNGATLIGTATSAPYNFAWNNVPVGIYTLTARATDNLGAQSTSATTWITVSPKVTKIYYIHADHLGTPRTVTDAANQIVWRNLPTTEPFGNSPPEENPSGLGIFKFNLRFAGQYADRETNLNYNYFRDYDPSTGRYVQSDPIGLAGGVNTYSDVNGNLVSYVNPDGLDWNTLRSNNQ